jgi:DNA-binding protein H-NS
MNLLLNGIEGRAELAAEAQRITSQLQHSHEAELAQRQAAAQAAAAARAQHEQTQQTIGDMANPFAAAGSDARRQLQLYNDAFMTRAMQPPTRCSWIGNFWTCQ